MFEILMSILLFGFAYAIKGGSGKSLFPWWAKLRAKNVVTERLFDGKVMSTLLVFLYGLFYLNIELTGFSEELGVPVYATYYLPSALLALAWLLSVAPSMGEEHGAVGDHKEWWGPYRLKQFGRKYGIKKALQRGAWMGFVFILLTPYTMVGWTSLLFVPIIFVGQSMGRLTLKERGWALVEPLIGGLCIGLGISLS